MTKPGFRIAARAEDLTGEGPFAASVDGIDVVLVKDGASLRAFEGRCPHRGALLGEGEMEGGRLVCRNHRWRFDAATGARDGGTECLTPCEVREEDGRVLVDVGRLAAARTAARVGKRKVGELPGPRVLPLVGSSHLLDLGALHLQLEDWARRYGTPYRFAIGPRDVLVLSDMEEMSPVLRERPETFRRGSNLEPVFRELGVDGVFSAEGAAWRPQRRLAMEALSHRHLRSFYPTLARVAERLRDRWRRAVAQGTVLDIAEELKRFTVDVTTELVFGYDIDTLSKEGDVVQEKLGLIFPVLNRRLFTPIPHWRLIRMPADRAVDRAIAELRTWLDGLTAAARARLAADPERASAPQNFLEAMLVARDEKGRPFDDTTIFGNALTMLLAGEDTTAYTLAWCVHLLLESPASVAELRRELDARLGDDPTPRDIDVASGLAYAGAIANESMRLRPVAPLLFHEPLVDTVIGDLDVPKGTLIAKLMRAPATSATSFVEPERFLPERWLDDRRPEGPHEPSAHQPFGSGPRICPGRSLALLEMKLVLATLYQSFDVERVGPASGVREIFAFTMMPEGLEVRLSERARRERPAQGQVVAS